MNVDDKVKADLRKMIKDGNIKRRDQVAINSYVQERANYYGTMDKMDRGGKLALVDLLFQLTHGPFAIVDFLVKHPIKTFKAIVQAAILGIVVYIIIFIYKGGEVSQLLNIFQK